MVSLYNETEKERSFARNSASYLVEFFQKYGDLSKMPEEEREDFLKLAERFPPLVAKDGV
jgi:hypothetical protein